MSNPPPNPVATTVRNELSQALGSLLIETPGRGLVDITRQVAAWLEQTGVRDGLVTLFIRHTSASLTIQENADPDVRTDLTMALDRLAPADLPYRHTLEGPDDMPAHVKTMLTGVNLAIPITQGRMALGTWQGIYVAEHRTQPHRRDIVLHVLGTFHP